MPAAPTWTVTGPLTWTWIEGSDGETGVGAASVGADGVPVAATAAEVSTQATGSSVVASIAASWRACVESPSGCLRRDSTMALVRMPSFAIQSMSSSATSASTGTRRPSRSTMRSPSMRGTPEWCRPMTSQWRLKTGEPLDPSSVSVS